MATDAETRGAYEVDEHNLSPQEVAERYGVQLNWENLGASKGLTAAQVEELRAKYGLNRLKPPKTTPEIVKFLLQFVNPLMALLLVASGLLFLAYGLQEPRDQNNLILACALGGVVTLTCVMTYFQERSAGNVMASLKKMMPNKCTVMRDGVEIKVEAHELVPGDLVRLGIGDRVPADVRIIETFDLKVECSSLTGESDLVPATVNKKHDLPVEARNLLFMSTLCMNGQGRGIVIRTGDNTMIGKIATLATDTNTEASTLQREVKRLVIFIACVAVACGLILFAVGIGRNPTSTSILQSFVNGFILVIVANVPEGLPATVTSLLSLTALRLKNRNVLIKRTDIIENLGAATIIASDKTGTLTQNKMTVENVWCNCELHKGATFQPPPQVSMVALERRSLARNTLTRRSRALGKGSVGLGRSSRPLGRASLDTTSQMTVGRAARPKGDGTVEMVAVTSAAADNSQATVPAFSLQAFNDVNAASWDASSTLTKLVTIATVCNKATFTFEKGDNPTPAGAVAVPMFQGEHPDRKVLGDATDSGLLRYCDRLTSTAVTRLAYKKLFEIPFNSANKWAMLLTENPGDSKTHLVFLKGAPEIIITKCSHYYQGQSEKPIDEDFKSNMNGAYERCGFMGERVIGFAYKRIPAEKPETYDAETNPPPTTDLVFMGLISLVDPPRDGVLEAVHKCRSAGIRVAMVTGDHPLTAEAIARKVGIITLQTAREVAAEAGVPESEIATSDERVGAVVVTGQQIRGIQTEEEWDTILDKDEIVFARTSPQQKLQIVENLQRLGEVVAVTGDGVNDSPALKKAQIGVAMGLGGSDVAREAADIVLLDDQFPSIANAIEEGRVIFDNLKKTIAYTLTHAVPEVFPIALNLILWMPLGLGGLLILAIDLVTEQGPAISLAYEPAEANVMDRPPRDIVNDRLISGTVLRYAYLIAGIMQAWICMVAFFSIFLWYDVPISAIFNNNDKCWKAGLPETSVCGPFCTTQDGVQVCQTFTGPQQQTIYFEAQSAWFVTLVMCQFWHIWTCKTREVSLFRHGPFRNPVTIYGTSVSLAVAVILVYVPFLQSTFQTGDLPGIGWLPNLIFALWVFPYSEYSKYMVRTDPDSWWSRNMAW